MEASSPDKSGIFGRSILIPKVSASESNKRNEPLKKDFDCFVQNVSYHIFQ